jgi:hypothetical protein
MKKHVLAAMAGFAALMWALGTGPVLKPAYAQDTAAAAEQATAPEPLSDDEMEVLVARIALYPDELVAAIVAASLYPVQIVQAQRFLDQRKQKPDLQPDKDWDGSVISLLNYPEIVKMMSDDLDWTESLGDVATNQQKDMLEAIQQLRDKAVAQGVLKSDEKTVVTQESGKVVIQPASSDKIYVPVYEPQMLYDPAYVPAPITYYPEPYPSYYYPTAPFFAGFVTGAIWGAVIDWNDWGVWGGNGPWGNDIDINCRNCFNNRDFNGNIKWNDVDWANVDRSKIDFDRNQFNQINKNDIRRGLESNDRNNLKNKANDRARNQPAFSQQGSRQAKDVRKSTLDGLQKQGKQAKAGGAKDAKRPSQGGGANKAAQRPSGGKVDRPSGKKKPAAKADTRQKKPSPMGDINRGQKAKQHSNRGGNSMGGGINRGGGGAPKVYRRQGGGGFGGGGGRGGGRGGRR